MDNVNRCENCGRKNPCQDCLARGEVARQEALLDWIGQEQPGPIIVWFSSAPDVARQHLGRLVAEWPGAFEVIEPVEPDDLLGCRIAHSRSEIGRDPSSEWTVGETRVVRDDCVGFSNALTAHFAGKV